jgi:hypothetical protein
MNPTDFNVLEKITKPGGFEFDLREAFRKLATSQFGGNPGRGFCELIQNAIDSYPLTIPLQERKAEIRTSENAISIRDCGEGMPIERINLLATLGGTDKEYCADKIGKFGMGFFSIFNPKLQTKKVVVRTRCDSSIVVLEFILDQAEPTALPKLRTKLVREGEKTWHGSEITIEFRSPAAVETCLLEAKRFVRFFPCPVFINGELFVGTIWEEARKRNARFFEDGGRHGFLETKAHCHKIALLCKYEPILELSAGHFSTGGQQPTGDLRDFKRRGVPFVPGTFTLVNDNRLNVTVSRDSVMMDEAYRALVQTVAAVHTEELREILRQDPASHLIPPNQFVFAREILHDFMRPRSNGLDPLRQAIAQLADAPVYRLAGKVEPVSLRFIWARRSPDKPVFFSPRGLNSTWLGGAFEHDFIVLPPNHAVMNGGNGLYGELFSEIFRDTVNLDTIRENRNLIRELVQRGIVQPELLSPKCQMMGTWEATAEEQRFLAEVNEILALAEVKRLVQEILHLSASPARAVLFAVQDEGVVVATGLFGEDGRPFDPESDAAKPENAQRELKLGLMRTHPLIRHLIESIDSHRAFYALSFLAHQLVDCQRMLVPNSSFRNWLIGRLGRELRAMMLNLLVAEPPEG